MSDEQQREQEDQDDQEREEPLTDLEISGEPADQVRGGTGTKDLDNN
jgi:hypothetical protein